MKKNNFIKLIVSFTLCVLIILSVNLKTSSFVVVADDGNVEESYKIYDQNYNYLFEKSYVQIGDVYVGTDFKQYEIVFLNTDNKTGIAKFLKQINKPKIKFSDIPSKINTFDKKIGLYCSHNDESYLPSDGYYTIYDKGGVHDVANYIKNTFENTGVGIVFDQTLHLPHDSGAYTRSNVTAKKLLKENKLNAIFDIHRDGIGRQYYATTVNGVERSKVRIVVGKSNPNVAKNEEFALYLVAVAQELYPWLISDIYYASGHYNQVLSEKSLLFEMGTYLIEKELVFRSVEPLVHTINVALFNTTIDSDTNELEIGGVPSESNQILDEYFESNTQNSNWKIYKSYLIVLLYIFIILLIVRAVIMATRVFKSK